MHDVKCIYTFKSDDWSIDYGGCGIITQFNKVQDLLLVYEACGANHFTTKFLLDTTDQTLIEQVVSIAKK